MQLTKYKNLTLSNLQSLKSNGLNRKVVRQCARNMIYGSNCLSKWNQRTVGSMAKSCSIEKDSFSFRSLTSAHPHPRKNKRDYIHSFHLISRTLVTFQLVNNCVFGRAFFPTGILFIYFHFVLKNLIRQSDGSNIDRGRREKKKRSVRSANKCLSTALPAAILFLFFHRPRVKQHSSSSPQFFF